ncbi:MAG: right-handed parallel beta-helix repeat-containing protein [bacterium]
MKMPRIAVALCLLGVIALGTAAQIWAAPQQIRRCTTISKSGSYELGRNLDAVGDCLVITTDYVTLDLAGFTIRGNSTGRGIVALIDDLQPDRKAITVRNGMVRNFAIGVDLSNVVLAMAERLTVSENSNTGLSVGAWAQVRDCLAQGNGTGISSGASTVLTRNVATFNTGIGIQAGYNCTLTENIAQENGTHGFQVSNGSNVFSNTSSSHPQAGFQVVCPSNIMGNTASFNSTAYELSSPSECNFVNNVPALTGD